MSGRWLMTAVAFVVPAAPAVAAIDQLPAEPPIDGPLWSLLVPALLFAVAFGATFMLYRHFTDRDG